MEGNSYQPPAYQDRPGLSWRSRWKRVCLISLCTAGIFLVIGKVVAISAENSTGGSWFKILDGLLALGELASWTMVGVGGIGWVMSRRTPTIKSPSSRSEIDA